MLKTTIPKSIQEIINEYISSHFRPFTYKLLSSRLRFDPNTIVQRINRNPEYFKIEGDRPKIIKLKKDLEEIYFYRDKNTCQICQKEKDPSELLIRFKDPNLKDEENWENVITTCQKCKDINLIKKLSTKEEGELPGPGNFIWEYKEIEIREIFKQINPYMKLYFPELKESEIEYKYEHYLEFNERNGQGWFHIIDDNNERCENLSDILNFFGKQGWELIQMKEYTTEYEAENLGLDDYHCIFKRKKNLEGD